MASHLGGFPDVGRLKPLHSVPESGGTSLSQSAGTDGFADGFGGADVTALRSERVVGSLVVRRYSGLFEKFPGLRPSVPCAWCLCVSVLLRLSTT